MNALRRARRDDGFTLIELLAASLIFALIFTVIGSIFLSLVRTQSHVQTTTSTTNAGQLLARSIDDGIRNSTGFRVTTVGSSDLMVVARTASNTASLTWTCTAWYYSAAGEGTVRMRSSSTAFPTPTSAQLAGWTLLLEGIAPRSGAPVFAADGPRLAVSYDATADELTSTAFDFTVTPLTSSSEISPC